MADFHRLDGLGIGLCAWFLVTALVLPGLATAETPTGWYLAGSEPTDYQTGLDSEVSISGQASAFLDSTAKRPMGFGTLMQTISAANYRGQRVRLTAHVKAQEITGWAGLWMRVDGQHGKMLSFDNMVQRPIQGTTDWRLYEVVLEVPDDSSQIAFGVLLAHKGKLWVDGFDLQTVDSKTRTTGQPLANHSAHNLPKEPNR